MRTFEVEPDDAHGTFVVDLSRGPVLQPQEQEQMLARRGEDLDGEAKALVVVDGASFVRAGQFLETVDAVLKQIEDFFEDDIARAYATWKGLTSKRAHYTKPLEHAKQIVAARYAAFERDEKERAEAKRRTEELEAQRAEQARLRAEAETREAAAKSLAEAAARADSRDEAMALQQQADEALDTARDLKVEAATVQAPVLPLQREVPTDTGPKVRAAWTFEVTDRMALIKAVAAGTVSAEAVMPNESYLRKRALADKATCNIPGVRVWDQGTVVQRRTGR
jgi:phage-related minor tail protein